MRRLLLAGALLLGAAASAFGQEDGASSAYINPFERSLSLEVGTGIAPAHMYVIYMSLSYERRSEFAQYGQDADMDNAYYPEVDLSLVWRTSERWEHAFTAGVSWCHHQVLQYEEFGIDPQGRPRYNLYNGTPAGWADSSPFASITWQARYLYNPQAKVQMYSGIGLGIVTDLRTGAVPLPAITLFGIRYTTPHFYFFAEEPLNPIAILAHGGLGWKF